MVVGADQDAGALGICRAESVTGSSCGGWVIAPPSGTLEKPPIWTWEVRILDFTEVGSGGRLRS